MNENNIIGNLWLIAAFLSQNNFESIFMALIGGVWIFSNIFYTNDERNNNNKK